MTATAFALLIAIAGCGKETPAQAQADVTKAEDTGAKDVAAATQTAADKIADANTKLAASEVAVAHTDVEATRNVAFAQAEAVHRVAIARCDDSPADGVKGCKAIADAELAAAKANAQATMVANDPKP
jgi:hypothetical protein